MFCGISKATTCVRMLSFGTDAAPQSFCHSFIALSTITFFKVSPEIGCSGVSSRCCCYRYHTAGSKPILKLLITVNVEFNTVSLYQKLLVKVVNW